jgi:hypothetical protein
VAAVMLNPGALALTVGALLTTAMALYSCALGVIILRRWDIDSSSALQLELERKTCLISTVMDYAMGFGVLSAFLFVYTVDDFHGLFVGAMCATGSLNANPVGWYALTVKIVLFFLAAAWITLNRLDSNAPDYPLVKLKYALLLVLAPVFALDFYLQTSYFAGLKPTVISSCCGSLFDEGAATVAASLASLPERPAMLVFYGTLAMFFALAALAVKKPSASANYALSSVSALLVPVSLAAIISFVSPYYYEIPTHHCPFDVLQRRYGYVGYPLYISLFGGAYMGMAGGLFEFSRKIPSVSAKLSDLQRRWTLRAAASIAVFVLVSTWPVVFSALRLM